MSKRTEYRPLLQTAERLLGRSLQEQDGVPYAEIIQTEARLKCVLPEVLKEFYLLLGNHLLFISAFEQFIKPDELKWEGNKLIFLNEHQGVCCWGVDIDFRSDNPLVYQGQFDDETDGYEWYSEELTLKEFIIQILYYQCAMGAYAYYGESNFEDNTSEIVFLNKLNAEWEKVVDHRQLIIYWHTDKLIWFYTDEDGNIEDGIFLSARTQKGFDEMTTFGFTEPGIRMG